MINYKLKGRIAWFVTLCFLIATIEPNGFLGFLGVFLLSLVLFYPVLVVWIWMEHTARLYMYHRKNPD